MQFDGMSFGQTYWGASEEGWYMMRASGQRADDLVEDASGVKAARCTRIDLQLTLTCPLGLSMRQAADEVRHEAWPGPKRKVTLVEGDDGLDTVYLGSRTSERFCRIYVKMADGVRWVRMEYEYKGELARGVWSKLANGGKIAPIMRSECLRLPTTPLVAMFCTKLAGYDEVTRGRKVPDDNATYRWLIDAVTPAVVRMMRSHDLGERTRRLVEEWAKIGQDIDNDPA
jgi:hypothetical protein